MGVVAGTACKPVRHADESVALVRFATDLEPGLDQLDLVVVLRQVAGIVEETMGGTSGAIYAIFLNAVSSALEAEATLAKDQSLQKAVSSALRSGLDELYRYTSARVGGRTMMDALIPFVEVLSMSNDLVSAVKAAENGAAKTRKMEALLGRASYVSKEQFALEKDGIPDPGALGIVALVRGIATGLSS